jgi:hypothetical protein
MVLDEQEGRSGPWLKRIGQSPRTGPVKGRRIVGWRWHCRTAVRNGHDCRQERAEVLVITDGQPFDGSVFAFADEEHVEQPKNSPAAEEVDLCQDPVLSTRAAAKAQRDHLQRCGHRCLLVPVRNAADGTTERPASWCIRPRQELDRQKRRAGALPSGTGGNHRT